MPRLLRLKDAATYCGLPARNFRKHIGIAPLRLGPYELWDRKLLDAYIDGLQSNTTNSKEDDWTDAVKDF